VLFVLKIEGIFEKKNQPKSAERGSFLYIYNIDYTQVGEAAPNALYVHPSLQRNSL